MNDLPRYAALMALCLCGTSGTSYAQSSVTLYGVLDDGLNYTSNAGGHHAFAMVSGDTAETSFGLKGTEDLGGGLSAIFTLENGVNLNNGQLNEGGRLFGRQAFVGLSSEPAGTLTFGRQYDATIDMWSPFTAAGSSIGDLAAHPFDNDNADFDFRLNNSVKYVSPTLAGFQLEGVYGFSNATNFSSNRAYSAGVTYSTGPLSVAVAYLHLNGAGSGTDGAVTSDAVFVATRQQNIDAGVKWTFSNNANIALAYSHVDVRSPTGNGYAPDIGTQTWTSWKFDNIEVNGQYYFQPDLSLIGAYTFTHGKLESTAGSDSPNWHQVALMLNYSLSKRTSVYVQGAWQHTNANTGTDLDGAHIVGSSGLSSSGNQVVARLAMSHKF
ncbi:porin [Paraburkholderia sabiae]|uniref:Porin n=1 Tax=Paraburkholderia sabiae TaxID=273251 RepID=A0ABU9Q7G4_9BURK|nr:porin [Paraburkholderia sabiae]WJZ79026.1 porin [Paraburkholderia sabiae]CAD6513950.1 Outer membrane porin protein [Paraburkholderia sabiae]CAG9204081.1 Porin Gram-negative type [Paraburkholderia sabiae]